MISWIQRTLQHHFKMIFSVVLAGTIVSFIMTIGASPGIGSGEHKVVSRDFFGYNLASEGDMQRIMSDGELSIELEYGYQALDEDRAKSYALDRIAALHLAQELHLPPTTPDEEAAFIKGLRMFAGQDGAFDASRYDAFKASLRPNAYPSEGDIARVIGDDARVRKIEELLDGPGYVLPSDVRAQLVRTDTSWTIDVATLDYTSFHPDIAPTDADLTKFFDDNAFRYQIPPKVETSMIEFPASNYLSQVTLADADIRAYYDANKAAFPAPKPAAPKAGAKETKPAAPVVGAQGAKADNPDADFAAVRPQVEAALKLDRAKALAAQDASNFAYSLYQHKVAEGAALNALLVRQKLTMKPLAPFTEEAGPAELGGSKDFAEAAFKLDSDQYYSEAIPTANGAVIAILRGAEPARKPLLIEVKDKVRSDYIEEERRKRFTEFGTGFRDAVAASLKKGMPFDKAAAAAADKVKVETSALAPFTLRAPPKDASPTVTGTLEHLEKGGLSDMVMNADKGYLVYAVDKKAPDLSENSPDYAQTRAALAGYFSQIASGSYLGDFVSQELKRSEPVAH